jgi:hypothetical protein
LLGPNERSARQTILALFLERLTWIKHF